MSQITYKYSARNTQTGRKINSVIQADSEQAASKAIIEMGMAPLEVSVFETDGLKGSLNSLFNRITTKDKILFSRQLATLINAGLPIVQSLRMVQGQTANKQFKIIISQIIADIEAGGSFSSVLKKHPKSFNRVFVSLVEAGEVSGTLDKSLERLAYQQEKDADLVSKVRGAMVYPMIVLLVMAAVVTFMLVSVLPQVKTLYDGLKGASLPLPTRLLLFVSDIVRGYWWLIILVVIALGFFFSSYRRTTQGRLVLDNLKIRMPLFGQLFQKVYMARFSRTGSTLTSSGVPLIRMLEICADTVANVQVSGVIIGAIEKVKGGRELSDALAGNKYFTDLVPSMLKIGEQSGQTELMFTKVADYYEREVDDQVKAISTVIEPLLMVVMGGIAIVIVTAILLPIYGLVGKNVF